MIRQRIEPVFWTLKDRLELKRIASKLSARWGRGLGQQLLGLPSRSVAQFAA
jgi:hypothetical protein